MQKSFMAQYGARLVDSSYEILPIVPGAKMPGVYADGFWRPMRGWQNAKPEVATWSEWPQCGIGIRCGAVVGIDIDIMDSEVVSSVERILFSIAGKTDFVRIGQSPKRMLVYRTNEPFRGIKRHPIEVLATGQQFVAFAIHAKTGQPYQWPIDNICEADISELPLITKTQVGEFIKQAYAAIPKEYIPSALKPRDSGAEIDHSSNDLEGTPEAIADALEFIENDELNYDDWIRIGLAIRGALGPKGFELFAKWSAKAKKNVPEFTLKTWRSFKPNRIGAGTIYDMASQNGWVPDADITLNGVIAAMEEPGFVHPAQAFLDKILRSEIKPAKAKETELLPVVQNQFGIYDLNGVLKLFVDYILKTAISPQPKLALAAAITCLGAVAGRRYRSPTGLRTNIYTIGVCDSGGGKDHPRKCVKTVLSAAGLSHLHGGDRIASGQGLITAVQNNPAIIFQIDEFGHFLKKVLNDRNQSSHIAEIWHVLTELFTASDTIYMGTEYANKSDRPRITIANPNVCLFGTTVPGPLWSAIGGGQVGDGSIARYLVFETDNHYPDRVKSPEDIRNVPPELIEGIKRIASASKGEKNLSGIHAASIDNDPITIRISDDAEALVDDILHNQLSQLRKSIGTQHTAIFARIYEHVIKLAMVSAISDSPQYPFIDVANILWAREVVYHCVNSLIKSVDISVSEGQYDSDRKKTLAFIKSKGETGAMTSEITLAIPVRSTIRRELLSDLVDSGVVRLDKIPGATKPFYKYTYNI